VELLHTTSKYYSGKTVIANTIINGSSYWDENYISYVVFPNPSFTDNLSIRVTMISPSREVVMEEKVIDTNVATPLDVSAFVESAPPEVITESMVEELKPKLEMNFLNSYPLTRGRDMTYSGGGDRLLPKDGTFVKQTYNQLEPYIVEIADAANNLVDIRLYSMTSSIPTGWTVNVPITNYKGISTTKYDFAKSWQIKVFNYNGNFELRTRVCSIADKAKGMFFNTKITLSMEILDGLEVDSGELDSATVRLLFFDASNNIISAVSSEDYLVDSLVTTPIDVQAVAHVSDIPDNAVSCAGSIVFGTLSPGQNATFTMELPQFVNSDMVTFPVYRKRQADNLVVSNRNMVLAKGIVACEYMATHNRKCYFFDTRRNNLSGFAGYYNGGKLGLIINDGTTNYEFQTNWYQKWHKAVLDKDIVELPTDPSTGDRYLIMIKSPKLGLFFNKIAEWNGIAWTYESPTKGRAIWVTDETCAYVYNGTNWVFFECISDGRSSVCFWWDSSENERKIYGNGILLTTDTTTFSTPRKTYRIVIGSTAYGTFYLNTQIIRFVADDKLVLNYSEI